MKEQRYPQLDERAVTAHPAQRTTRMRGAKAGVCQKVRLFCHQLRFHGYQIHLDGPGL